MYDNRNNRSDKITIVALTETIVVIKETIVVITETIVEITETTKRAHDSDDRNNRSDKIIGEAINVLWLSKSYR